MKPCPADQNVLSALVSREYYNKSSFRRDVQVLKTLVCRGNYEFRKVWEQSSKQLISCESNIIFLNNYRTAYFGYEAGNTAPVLRLSLSQSKMPRKIVDAALSRPRPTEIHTAGTTANQPGPKLYGITSTTLLVVDLNQGHVIFETLVLNSRLVKFKHINWLQPEESLVLSTTLCPRTPPGLPRPLVQGPNNLVKILAVFTVTPFAFVCMFEVTREVFGADVTDTMMCQGLLIIMHQSRLVRMYDFNQLLREHKITPMPLQNSQYENTTPFPFNLKITALPCCLFEVKCDECNVQMGGHPWHYLISPVGSRGSFQVHSLETGLLAQNGSMQSDGDSIETDRAVFHADDSSRIIHINPEEVRILSLKEREEGGYAVTPSFTIQLHYSPATNKVFAPPVVTSSGRTVKRRVSLDEISGVQMCTTIHEVDYEDEVDVMMVVYTVHQPNALQGTVGLYDNLTGRHLRSVQLDEPWPDYSEHNVSMDKDTIVHTVKSTNGKFHCQVYRLFGCRHGDEPGSAHKPDFSEDTDPPRSPRRQRQRRPRR